MAEGGRTPRRVIVLQEMGHFPENFQPGSGCFLRGGGAGAQGAGAEGKKLEEVWKDKGWGRKAEGKEVRGSFSWRKRLWKTLVALSSLLREEREPTFAGQGRL